MWFHLTTEHRSGGGVPSCVMLLVIGLATAARAQVIPAGMPAVRAESAVVTPDATYRGGGFGRFLFGDHYRDVWTTPIRVPILSLRRYAGGLRVTTRGGSMQTKALHFAGADGREYVFRSVNKDPAQSLPPDLRETYAKQIVRDLVSAEHPGGALVVARLLEGAGVLHATPQLFLMPNDTALGTYRREFAGMLGWLEIRPTEENEQAPGFADATRLVSSQKLLERLEAHADEQVDARAYLKARLIDVFVGDWDRHAEQWRWARFGDKASDRWQPIPRDRDWALVRLDGVVWSLVRFAYPYPQFVSFERRVPDMVWLTWNGRLLDRRFLSALDRPTWDSIATALRVNITDTLIDDAVRSLPPEQYAASGEELARTLRWRRDHLMTFADGFYRMLASEVEIHGTDAGELVTVDRIDERFTDVSMRALTKAGAPRSRVSFQRRFDAAETEELRIYLHGGDDRFVVRGAAAHGILVRVVAGGDAKTYLDSTGSGGDPRVRIYDVDASSEVESPMRASVDRRHYTPPPTRQWFAPARDWGERWRPLPWLGYTPDIGLFVGGGPLLEHYGFRSHPYEYRMSLRVGYATGVGRWRAEYDADFRHLGSALHATLFARASAIDVVHYYGPGNESEALQPRGYYRVDQQQYALDPTLIMPLGAHTTLGVGPTIRRVVTARDTTLLGRSLPGTYGAGTFTQAGARMRLALDTRNRVEYPTRGVFVSTQASAYPSIGSVTQPYAALRSEASTYLTAGGSLTPTLALRVGGDKLWGSYPFFDAAFVGGGSTIRGFNEQRFAGNASLYGNAELRVFLTKFFFLLPSDLGVFGLADAGRVFAPGERSNAIHEGFGGGVWVSPLGRSNTISLAIARSRDGSGVYLRSGFPF
jgi:hypothetical protein